MNCETLLTDAETAIKNRTPSKTGKYYLTIIEGKIVCLPVIPKQPPKNVIRKLSNEDAEKGFTSRTWYEIGNRLFKEVERLEKCQMHHKH